MKPPDIGRCLQNRAERAASQFAEKARKPLVIEFAGVPKAGKTTTLTSSGETSGDPRRTAEVVTETILALVEEQVAEDIISCPKESVIKSFAGESFIRGPHADSLIREFRAADDDSFRPREEVEQDKSRVQAIPIVIVRNASGEVLRLRRREKTADNPLHDKIVIWAGGHVRHEDSIGGDPLVLCAVRELEEELRLQVDSESLRLIGAVYLDSGGKTSKHVGIAYEWRASTDDVAVVLSRSEFFERRGTSLSGSFASIDALARDVEEGNLVEPWSVELIREYLAKETFNFTPRLF